jgi:hypothetical protein
MTHATLRAPHEPDNEKPYFVTGGASLSVEFRTIVCPNLAPLISLEEDHYIGTDAGG